MKRVTGMAVFVSSSTKRYVPIEQCGWQLSVTFSSPLRALISLENGVTQESGNQSAYTSQIPV